MQTKEKLAEEYAEMENSAYTNDYHGFINGFNACEELLKKYITFIEDEESCNFLSRPTNILTGEEKIYLANL